MTNYNEIKLDKSLYSITGKSFTQALAQLDPDEGYASTELAGLDAFERQLKRFDIRVCGEGCDRVEKFFTCTESAVLFPEYVRRTIKQGMNEASILGDIVAARSYTDGMDFRALSITKSGDSIVSPGSPMSSTTVSLANTSTSVKKFARKLSCPYESIRKQRIETFGVILKSLGAWIARSINLDAANVLKTGVTATDKAGSSLEYSDLAALWASLTEYNMTTVVTTPEVMAQILALPEMKYCVNDYYATGKVKTPYGVTIIKCEGLTGTPMIGFDNKCALEAVFASDVVVDVDKLLSTQCNEISCSVMVGFAKIAAGAVAVKNA